MVPLRPPLILVVEDEPIIAMELDLTLGNAGFQVLGPVPSVSAALKLIGATRPDAAILDVNLAGEWVTPVAVVLQAMLVPFILASGYGPADLCAEPVLRQAVNVGKAWESELLLKAVRGILRSTDGANI
jgi:DNA-binding NtrC family response regulator